MKNRVKRIKRIVSLILAWCLLFAFHLSTVAVGVVDGPVEVAENFLQSCTENMYLYSNHDIDDGTVFELNAEKQGEVLNAISQKNLSDYNSEASLDGENLVGGFDEFSEYIHGKVDYFKDFREERNIARRDFGVTYDLLSCDIDDNIAQVSLYESVRFYYEGARVETFVGTIYNVLLCKVGDNWVVCDVISNDEFDSQYRADGVDFDVISEEASDFTSAINYQNSLVTVDAGISKSAEYLRRQKMEELTASLVSTNSTYALVADPSYVEYDGYNAMCYAMTYTTSASNDTKAFYNTNFNNYSTYGDCQNFASQCIWAGFGGSDDQTALNSQLYPMDYDQPNLWYDSNENGHTSSWTAPSNFINYIEASKTSGLARIEASTIGSDDSPVSVSDLEIGDEVIITGEVGDENRYSHAIIIVDITGSSYSNVYYCAHTADVKYKSITDFGSTPTGKIIHPEKFYYSTDAPCNGSHTYSAVSSLYGIDATCNTQGCTHNRMQLSTVAVEPMRVGTSLSLQFYCTSMVYRMAIGVTTPSGTTSWEEDTLIHVLRRSYTFTETGLYTITMRARDKSPDKYSDSAVSTLTLKIRIYSP